VVRCELHGTRHDEGEQSEQRDVGSGIDDDQEWSSHEFMVLRASGVQLRQPWQSAENVSGRGLRNEKALRREGFLCTSDIAGAGFEPATFGL
jgi:hypothetical protein